jgi:hypothetical protein
MKTTPPVYAVLYDFTNERAVTERGHDAADWAAQWGCDPCADKPPRLPGDGYLFYNYAVEGGDPAFLAKFIPAIDRTIASVRQDVQEAGDKLTAAKDRQFQRNIDNLNELKEHCARMLSSHPQETPCVVSSKPS